MATMFFAKNGLRPHTQSGPGTPVSVGEVLAIFPKDWLRYVGKEAPSINADRPSYDEVTVLVELNAGDEFASRLPKRGFYWVSGVRPRQADRRLRKIREP